MKRFLKTLVLLPMWPSIWYKVGFSLERQCCPLCGCCARAQAMVAWWRA